MWAEILERHLDDRRKNDYHRSDIGNLSLYDVIMTRFFRPRRKSYQSCKSAAAYTYRTTQWAQGSSLFQGWRRRLGVITVKRVNLGNSAKDAHFLFVQKFIRAAEIVTFFLVFPPR